MNAGRLSGTEMYGGGCKRSLINPYGNVEAAEKPVLDFKPDLEQQVTNHQVK